MELLHKDLTDEIIRTFYDVYNELGYGFLEKVYQNALFMELKNRSIKVEAQKQIKVYYKNIAVGLLLNFGIKPEFKRKVFDNSRKNLNPETYQTRSGI